MMITCFIRYVIGPFKLDAAAGYARNRGQTIPRCRANLIGRYARRIFLRLSSAPHAEFIRP